MKHLDAHTMQAAPDAHLPVKMPAPRCAVSKFAHQRGSALNQPCPKEHKASPLLELFEKNAFPHIFQPGNTILLHGAPADAIYLVVSGTVRCCTISPEGNRQIFRFATKGGFIGIADIDTWHFTAEAVDHVTVKVIARAKVEQPLAVNPPLRQELQAYMCDQLQSRERQLLMMVTSKAPERLYQFLCDFAATRPGTGYIALPMCRRDIADHLGLSVETVSRTFSELKRRGRISLCGAEKYKVNGTPETIPSPSTRLT
jgi:CRP-like cAMP-binding protein